MKLSIQKRWTILILFSIFLFLILQVCFFFILKKSFFFSSILGFFITAFISHFLNRQLIQAIDGLLKKILQFIETHLRSKIEIKSNKELYLLSKHIEQIELQIKNKTQEISRKEDYLKAILKGMVEGVLVIDERGKVILVNDAFKKLLSLPSDVSYRTPLEIIRNVQLEEAVKEVLQKGGNFSFELNLPSPLGKTFDVNISKISSFDIDPKVEKEGSHGVIVVFHDITRLKKLEKIRQDFVANVSHELRTPLTTIKGYAETLLEGALNEEVAHQFVQIIKKHSDRLEKIVEDLLMLSKIESKEFQWNMESILVSELITEALSYLNESFKKKNITVSIAPIPPNLWIYGDRQYLEQVLFNLLDNAIKYGREGGTVTISARLIDQKEAEIAVKDDGIGIPREDLSRIFERFYRVDKGRSRELGGTGLGLSIVKHIVQAHGGRIWAESQIGKGSTFYFTLPILMKSGS